MKWPPRIRVVHLIVVVLLFCLVAGCQARQPNACLTNSGTLMPSSSCHVIRAIEDPATHQRWLLVRDIGRPAAPALLVQIPTCLSPLVEGRSNSQKSSLPVIHPGDRLVVSEHTAVSEGRFDATALDAAAVGEPLIVRLKLGGGIFHAVATAPGRASLLIGRSEASE